jgi:hypothetical protein
LNRTVSLGISPVRIGVVTGDVLMVRLGVDVIKPFKVTIVDVPGIELLDIDRNDRRAILKPLSEKYELTGDNVLDMQVSVLTSTLASATLELSQIVEVLPGVFEPEPAPVRAIEREPDFTIPDEPSGPAETPTAAVPVEIASGAPIVNPLIGLSIIVGIVGVGLIGYYFVRKMLHPE